MRMNANLLRSVLCLCGLVAAALSSQSAPLRRADVAAEPTFVLHLDIDGLRPTAFGKFLLGEMDRPEAQGVIATLQTMLNLDPRKQLHGLTLYSTGKAPQDAVVLAYADFEQERLVTLAKGAKEYQSTSYKEHTIHSWINEQKIGSNGANPRVYAAFPGGELVILAQQEGRVTQALDVLDHKAASLVGSKLYAQLGTSGSASFVQAAARKLDIPDYAPNAALLRMAKMARLEVGEAQGQLKVTLNLEAGDEEVSQEMLSVGQGLIALMKLQQDTPASVKLAEGLSLRQEGTRVAATLIIPTPQAIELIKSSAARQVLQKANGR
jgi:hypothetical protein